MRYMVACLSTPLKLVRLLYPQVLMEAALLDLLCELAGQLLEVEGAHCAGQALQGIQHSVRSMSCRASSS